MHRFCKHVAAHHRSKSLTRFLQRYAFCRPSTSSASFQHMPNRLLSDNSEAETSPEERRGTNPFQKTLSAPDAAKLRSFESFVRPLNVNMPNVLGILDNVGKELAGSLEPNDVIRVLRQFSKQPEIRKLCREHGITDRIYLNAYNSFRNYCKDPWRLPPELYIILSDIMAGVGSVSDIYPFFLEHARKVFPHLEFMDELRNVADLTQPHSWYPEARSIRRKIIYHAGPTNSGKTFHALKRFMASETGVYCGPLKLLASEVFYRCKASNVACDLVTGDDRKYAADVENPSNLVSCTVEMVNTTIPVKVAVIDEIQMLRDMQRGWAWTRALLGVCAEEVHLCGEPGAVDLVNEILKPVGESVEVENYERITPLRLSDESLCNSYGNVKSGDCIVCFSKSEIFTVSKALETQGHPVAVIYGSLPPATKLAQAKKFNDPNDPVKIMVATDAVGMGLNLSIKRIVFYSLVKATFEPKNDPDSGSSSGGRVKKMLISSSSALQIGGRAGRFGTAYEAGEVTTFRPDDLRALHELWRQGPEPMTQAGIRPTAEQIEMFSLYLKADSLVGILNMFVSLCSLDDSNYFMCIMEDTMHLAELIDHVPLPIRTKYTFCLAPINRKEPMVCSMFVKFVRKASRNEAVTYQWLARELKWPLQVPKKISDLLELERIFDILDAYLWLGFRFSDTFPDMEVVRAMQEQLDDIIQEGVSNIVSLIDADQKNGKKNFYAIADINKRRRLQAEAKEKKFREFDDLFAEHSAGGILRSKKRRTVGAGPSVEDKLLKSGALSQKEMQQLKNELQMKEKKSVRKKK